MELTSSSRTWDECLFDLIIKVNSFHMFQYYKIVNVRGVDKLVYYNTKTKEFRASTIHKSTIGLVTPFRDNTKIMKITII
jgi:hypothetical protein